MYEVGKHAADFVVEEASQEAERLEQLARHRDLRGPKHAEDRKRLRARAHDLRCVVAGINTGDGVTRKGAR